MRRITAALLLALCCGGCFGSDKPLYQGIKPLQLLHSGSVTSRDKDGKLISMMLTREANGNYRLTGVGRESGTGYLLRFFAFEGAPSDTQIVEVKDCEKGFKQCSKTGVIYELARLMPGKVERRDPDCSKTFSKLSGIKVKINSCDFSDRASLEKALRVAAAMPWKADATYILH